MQLISVFTVSAGEADKNRTRHLAITTLKQFDIGFFLLHSRTVCTTTVAIYSEGKIYCTSI